MIANTNIYHVNFDSDNLILVEQNDIPYVPIRPLAENLGLNWSTQKKIDTRFANVVKSLKTQGSDGKRYEMGCLPLRKLPGWLYTINSNKVKPELKAKVEHYQEQCDEALWQYWSDSLYPKNAR